MFSIIITTKNEGINLKNTIFSLTHNRVGKPFEIIVVDDGSTDHSTAFIEKDSRYNQIKLIKTEGIGLARAKNLGAKYASGKYLVFSDAHMSYQSFWLDYLEGVLAEKDVGGVCPAIASLAEPDRIGYGQTLSPEFRLVWLSKPKEVVEVPVMPGGLMVLKSKVFFELGGFEELMERWGWEDAELSLRLWLMGYRLLVAPKVVVYHLFRERQPYPTSRKATIKNLFILALNHLSEERVKKILKLYSHWSDFPEAFGEILFTYPWTRRQELFKARKYDDDWFFKKFKIVF
ncbi:glycosyltransferase [Carboxydothermus pertinax]|uniref:Glycosyl transferase n=1 Tax=Carboxydothermus pertinax TaxID=870242 RepID=A0A1L8CT93_9THEO|nr:glycosyltransferase [Carboxydothermus pertinax]GAV22150.1 glycosyl transferase [Carboxydothermus pertinax]